MKEPVKHLLTEDIQTLVELRTYEFIDFVLPAETLEQIVSVTHDITLDDFLADYTWDDSWIVYTILKTRKDWPVYYKRYGRLFKIVRSDQVSDVYELEGNHWEPWLTDDGPLHSVIYSIAMLLDDEADLNVWEK